MIHILHGDARMVLPTLDAASVQCVVTSPPYFGLRRYLDAGHVDAAMEIGSEVTPDEYIAALVTVFREVRRVCRDDATVWLNLGDSYAGHNVAGFRPGNEAKNGGASNKNGVGTIAGAKPKDLLMIPARVALALQGDGWWLRSDIIWAKPNPMPESVTDRPTSAHEHVFLLTRSARYFFDADAVRVPLQETSISRGEYGHTCWAKGQFVGSPTDQRHQEGKQIAKMSEMWNLKGANCRNVWTIATAPYSEAHFATFPPELAERCIRAGSKSGDTILDPFAGAFTAPMVADRLQRHAIGIELSEAYCAMARARITKDAGMFAEIADAP